MNSDNLVELLRSVNNGAIDLINSLSAFSALAGLNNQFVDEAEFFSEFLRVLLENQNVECCGLFLKQEQDLQFVCHACWGQSAAEIKYFADDERVTLSVGEGEIGQVAQSGQILSKQCREYPEFLRQSMTDSSASNEVAGITTYPGSLLCVPLINQQVTYGVLCLYHSKSDYFNATHEHFFSLLAHFLVQMFINNRATKDLEDQVRERTSQLEEALQLAQNMHKDLQDQSLFDVSTGLPNRSFFCVESRAALARANRHGRDFSCCLLEISNFNKLIKEQGLFAGDKVLEIIADVLKIQVREGDILAHFRGTQFIVALPEVCVNGARLFAERINRILSDARRDSEELAALELQIGLSSSNADLRERSDQALELLMSQADRALQAGKFKQQAIIHFSEIEQSSLVNIS